jgi:hypothetical protein
MAEVGFLANRKRKTGALGSYPSFADLTPSRCGITKKAAATTPIPRFRIVAVPGV